MKTDKRVMKAVQLQEKGKIVEAEAIYRNVVKNNPADFVCNYQLGVITFSNCDYSTALVYFECAKKVNSVYAPLWYNTGITLGRLGRYEEAIVNIDQAINIDPAYQSAVKQRESLIAFMKLDNNKPANTQTSAYSEKINRAFEMQAQGLLDDAVEMFYEILAGNPSDIPTLYSLGLIEITRKDPEKALTYFERCLVVRPDYALLWYNRGVVTHSLKQHDKAIESYEKALALDPGYKEAMINRGAVLVEMKRHKDALLNYEELLKVDPNNDKALCNRGIILTDFKLNDLAIQTFERLIQISPDYDYALGLLSFAKLHACSWENLAKYNSMIIEGIHAGKRVCKTQALLAISNEPREHLLCAQIFARHFYPVQEPVWRGEVYDHKKIRIAYISPDFREHPVGHLTAGIFENHDKDKFEIIAISLGIDDNSSLRERMLVAFDKFIDVRQMSSRDVAVMMREMEIDIAVDLGGYTADTRTDILAHRPAPIQVNYLGYSSTMGAEYIDYIIADRHIIPEEYQDCYSEQVVYLPDVYLPTDSSVKIAETTPPREEYGLPAEGFVFCSFNHDYKINPPMFDVWMRLLKMVPGSVLWLMKLNESAEQNLMKEAEARGIDASRIIFATRVPRIEDHLARYRLADLFLDTTPYNAHTTTSDVLRVGLPVLTCMGKAFAGRVAGSLLHAVGLPEMITHSLEEYENMALQLAREPDRLESLRRNLQENLSKSPLYDTSRYCRNLEAAYVAMYERYQRCEKPDKLTILPPELVSTNIENACKLTEAAISRITVNPYDAAGPFMLATARESVVACLLESGGLFEKLAGPLGKAHMSLMSAGVSQIASAGLDATYLYRISSILGQNSNSPEFLSAWISVLLYASPDKLHPLPSLEGVPHALQGIFRKYLFTGPRMFIAIGEIDAYANYFSSLIGQIRKELECNPDSSFWNSIALDFINSANMIPLYFAHSSLKDAQQNRAFIIEHVISRHSSSPGLNYEFQPYHNTVNKIRVGILAAHFCPQTETYATLPVYRDLDKNLFEVILISQRGWGQDPLEQYCLEYADHNIGLNQKLADDVTRIRELNLDLLWIGTNLTAVLNYMVQLSVHRLARLQVVGGCCPTTTGFKQIDLFVSGTFTESLDASQHYSEKLELVDGPAHCFDMAKNVAEAVSTRFTRNGLGIDEDSVVYVSGANFFKIIPELIETWCTILCRVPKSRMILFPFNPNWTSHYPASNFLLNLEKKVHAAGLSCNPFIIRSPLPARSDVVELMSVADVYLDSFPYSGMTSLLDPYEAGLPIVALEGEFQRERMSASVLRSLNLTECISTSREEYIEQAVRLGTDSAHRNITRNVFVESRQKIPKFLDVNWYGKEISRIVRNALADN